MRGIRNLRFLPRERDRTKLGGALATSVKNVSAWFLWFAREVHKSDAWQARALRKIRDLVKKVMRSFGILALIALFTGACGSSDSVKVERTEEGDRAQLAATRQGI